MDNLHNQFGLGNMISCGNDEPKYKCDKCKDIGMVEFEQEVDGETHSFWRVCDCVKAKEAERKMRSSGLGAVLEAQTFENFKTETELQKAMKQAALNYLDALQTGTPWFYIGGNPGSGKTHLCTAICGELLKKGWSVKYMQWVAEARRLKAYVNEPDFDNLVDEYITCDALYIDDLFKMMFSGRPCTPTEADVKIAFTIFNARYLQNKPTIISSEWDIVGDLLEADEGTFSRVYERSKGHTVTIPRDTANNYRLRRWSNESR